MLLQGANANYLGKREPAVYGSTTVEELSAMPHRHAEEKGYALKDCVNGATAAWQLSAPPKNWKELVHRAERFHIVGVWVAILAFAFLLTAVAFTLAAA